MALVVSAFLMTVSDFSLAALVQRPRITEADRSAMFWTALGLGAVMTTVGIALSGSSPTSSGSPRFSPSSRSLASAA